MIQICYDFDIRSFSTFEQMPNTHMSLFCNWSAALRKIRFKNIVIKAEQLFRYPPFLHLERVLQISFKS